MYFLFSWILRFPRCYYVFIVRLLENVTMEFYCNSNTESFGLQKPDPSKSVQSYICLHCNSKKAVPGFHIRQNMALPYQDSVYDM